MSKSVYNGFTISSILVLLVFSAVIFLSFHQTSETRITAGWVAHTHEVKYRTAEILSLVKDIETGTRDYVFTGQPGSLELIERSKSAIGTGLDTLKQLLGGNLVQLLNTDTIHRVISRKIAMADSVVQVRQHSGIQAAAALVAAGTEDQYMNRIRQIAGRMQDVEDGLLVKRESENAMASMLMNRIIISIIIITVLLVILLSGKDYLAMREKNTAETALRKNELYFELMAANIKDYAIFMLDVNGAVITWNRGAESLLGYDKHEITGRSYHFLFTPRDIETDEPARTLGLAKKYLQYETEGIRLKKDGILFWANVVVTSLLDESSVFFGYSVIIRDITERKKEKEQLEFLSKQIHFSNDAIFVVDADRRIKSWNRGAENLYGYSLWEVMDKEANVLLKTGFPDQSLEEIIGIIENKDYWTGELTRETRGGRKIIVRNSTSAIRDNKGIITGFVSVSFDVTSQQKLMAERNYLASLVEQTTEAIIAAAMDGTILSWNRGAEKLFGCSRGEVVGHKLGETQLVNKISGKKLLELITQVRDNGFARQETTLHHCDGSSFFCSVNASSIKDEQGDTSSAVFIINDISVRKDLEDQLQQSNQVLEERILERTAEIARNEHRFRSLIENSAEGIVLLDAKGGVLYRSPAANKISGAVPAAVLENIHPDDKPYMKSIAEQALSNPGIPVPWLGRFQHANGHYNWIEGTLSNLLDMQDVHAMVSNFRDVTSRKEAEDRLKESEHLYRNLFENMQSGFCYCKAEISHGEVHDFIFLHVNEEYERITRMKGVTGKRMSEINPAVLDASIKAMQVISQVVMCGKPEMYEQYSSTLGTWLSISVYSPETDYFAVLVDDITDRKEAENRIIQINAALEDRVMQRTEQLKKSNEELEAFSYSVSHDLRAPLRAIVGFTAILEEDYSSKLDEEARRITGVIKHNTLKMGYLIDDLLSFSRMGRKDLVKTQIDTAAMVAEIIHSPELAQVSRREVEWMIDILPQVNADINSLRQVWVNLMSNAVKYSARSEHPVVEIRYNRNNGNDVFTIRDNGVGFDEQYKSKLFRVFQRLHSAEEFEGTGIGLAIVDKIIDKHGGEVWAEAVPGKGASFSFSLPREQGGNH